MRGHIVVIPIRSSGELFTAFPPRPHVCFQFYTTRRISNICTTNCLICNTHSPSPTNVYTSSKPELHFIKQVITCKMWVAFLPLLLGTRGTAGRARPKITLRCSWVWHWIGWVATDNGWCLIFYFCIYTLTLTGWLERVSYHSCPPALPEYLPLYVSVLPV